MTEVDMLRAVNANLIKRLEILIETACPKCQKREQRAMRECLLTRTPPPLQGSLTVTKIPDSGSVLLLP